MPRPAKSARTTKDRARAIGFPKKSPSLESTSSIGPPGRPGRRDIPFEPPAFGPNLFDCCATLIYCPRHNNFGLTRIGEGKGMWLPYVPLRPSDGWYAACVSRLKQVLSTGTGPKQYLSFSQPELIHIFRLQVPDFCQFVTRVTFLSQLTHEEKSSGNCCQPNKTLHWFSADDVINQNVADLWGPEPCVFGEAFLHNAIEKGAYTEYTMRDAMRYMTRDPPKTFQDEMLKSANFADKDINRLYSEFIQHCYPSQYMVFPSFVDYMSRIGWPAADRDLENVYRAFGFNHMSYLSFHEFLLGLAAMDKQTHHGGHPGELRCGYIFRYYDTNNDGVLDNIEMARMIYDILRLKNKPHDDDSVEKEMVKNYQALGVNLNDPSPVVTDTQLLRAIGTMSFRGTSALFRAPFPILTTISAKRCYESLTHIQGVGGEQELKVCRRLKGICSNCKNKKFTIAVHCARVAPEGNIVEVQEVLPEEIAQTPKDRRAMSLIAFSVENVANRMIEWLRDYSEVANLGNFKRSFGTRRKPGEKQKAGNYWITSDRTALANAIIKLCADMENIFKREARCIKINSPVYVLGDTHGNLRDIMIYERILWRKAPNCVSASYLFLGDFVDRGEYGLECILYLFSCKILSPEKFWLIRGNHELRSIQAVFTFQRECADKFGKNLGNSIWDAINRAFDVMPICAVVDESIFCAHGGIPTSVTKIEDLQNIPTPLAEPDVWK
uniref:Serine/threonine-protein phosphatase n=1 Tax=Tetranychus urticae TaxID=32264 RepID=T1K9T8_TETUR